MLSLEHYNEEIARLVSSLQIETGKFPQPLILSLNPESIPFLNVFLWEKEKLRCWFSVNISICVTRFRPFLLKCLPTGP